MPGCQWDGCRVVAKEWLFSVDRGLEALCIEHSQYRRAEWRQG